MNHIQAGQIARLLNLQNLLVVQYNADRVLNSADNYLYELSDKDDVIACVELKRVQWYQCEVDHLTVDQNWLRRGLASRLLQRAEQHSRMIGGRILQCTIRENNEASQALFKKHGFFHVARFHYPYTGNNVGVWQKVISPPV